MGIVGIFTDMALRLFERLQVPSLPSQKDSAIGTFASFVILAQEARHTTKDGIKNIYTSAYPTKITI